MTPEQRKEVVKKFDNAKVKSKAPPITESDLPCCSHSTVCYQGDDVESSGEARMNPTLCKMSVSAEDSNISTLPVATLKAMWNKAEEYLKSGNSVVPAWKVKSCSFSYWCCSSF